MTLGGGVKRKKSSKITHTLISSSVSLKNTLNGFSPCFAFLLRLMKTYEAATAIPMNITTATTIITMRLMWWLLWQFTSSSPFAQSRTESHTFDSSTHSPSPQLNHKECFIIYNKKIMIYKLYSHLSIKYTFF